jgi:hypothetical protein
VSTNENDEQDGGAALTLAAVGGGAVLLWLLFRGRGKGLRGSGSGTRPRVDGERPDRDERPEPRREVLVRVRSGDRVEVDGVNTDLATTVTLARDAGKARFCATGDAREGWISRVYYALLDAGVTVLADPGITSHTMRFEEQGSPGGTANPQSRTPPVNSPVSSVHGRVAPPTKAPARRSLRDFQGFLTDVRNASPLSASQSCPARPGGGGALVRSSYRVPPFLADDVLLVTDTDSNTKGRVYCVAYDTTWHERRPERSGWLDRDTLTPILEPGMRVELSSLCPLWQRGAKHGTIRKVTKNWAVVVKMDDPRVRRLQHFTDHTQLTRRESAPEN